MSVVPRKLVPAMVPELPIMFHVFVRTGAFHQVASPVASETSIFHAPGAPPVIFTCPATSSLAPGVAVPIPILPAGDHTEPFKLIPKIALPILS